MISPMQPILRIAQLVHLLKRVEGRKKFQKLVHILQELGQPFPERFEYSYYGMYSAELRSELETLANESFVEEEEHLNLASNGRTYTFKTTDKLKNFLGQLGLAKDPPWVEMAKRLNQFNPRMLEGISTILFLRRRSLKGQELRERVLSLKPHLANIYDRCETEARRLLSEKACAATP